jgi:xanthine dehydrogenase molybdenum-binding subunit
MIPFDFEYYRPASVDEAAALYRRLDEQGKSPLYYSGGTEIITFGRTGRLRTGAVIDLKGIRECGELAVRDARLVLGSAITLSRLHDSRAFPLLGETAAGVGDRTSRNKITLGGNICSRLIYREAVLPLLLADSVVRIAGPLGARQAPIVQAFDRTLQLGRGEFLVRVETEARYASMPYAVVKRRQVAAIDYPVVTVAAMRVGAGIRAACSGVCAFPFRSPAVEEALNERGPSPQERIARAIERLPGPIHEDSRSSAEYRRHVLALALADIMRRLGGMTDAG